MYVDDEGMYNSAKNVKATNLMKALYADSGLANPFSHGVYRSVVCVHEFTDNVTDNKVLEFKTARELVSVFIRAYHRSADEYAAGRRAWLEFMGGRYIN